MRVKIIVAIIGLVPVVSGFVFADSAQDLTVISALTLNLARYTEWPSGKDDTGAIRLCVLGDNVVQQEFERINNMDVGTRKLEIVHLLRVKNYQQCHLLFVSGLDRSTVYQLLTAIKNEPILTVSIQDYYFLENSGMVTFNIVEDKVNIEINLNAVKASGLNISSMVLKLAKIYNP